MNNTLFSIILPTYNRVHMIAKAIHSIIDQTFTDWELIIVDDGSTDNTKEVLGVFNDHRIQYIYQENKERSAARNYGIRSAKGQYICFLDSDDYMLNNHLAEFKTIIESNNKKKAVYYCETYEDVNGKLKKVENTYQKTNNTIEFVLVNVIGNPRVCISRNILLEHKYNESINFGEDRELWSRIAKKYNFIPNHKYTTVFTTHNERSINSQKGYIEVIKLTQMIIKNDKEKLISNTIRQQLLSTALLNYAYYFERNKMKVKLFVIITKSIIYYPKHRLKEKTYILISNIYITNFLKKKIKH